MAYTPNQWEGEFTVQWLLVNDTLDILDVREDMAAGSSLFKDHTGDLNGGRIMFNLGIYPSVMAFVRGEFHEIVTELGESSTFGYVDSDRGVSTWGHEAGLRWNFLDMPFVDLAAAVEAAWVGHSSDDFSFRFMKVNAGNTMLRFSSPREIRLSSMKDYGWRIALMLSKAMGEIFLCNLWIGYESMKATSAISTTIAYAPIKRNFDRRFTVDEDQFHLGMGLIWQLHPRVPVEFHYEYLRLSRNERSTGERNTSALARYTNPEGLAPEESNHVLTGKIGFWLTPNLNLNLEGRLMTNQFLGIVPHYNNTITSRFFRAMYGYIGLGVGYAF